MPYGRIYIENLRSKVTILFDELKSTGQLGERNFISAFKNKYPKDYSMLEYEYRFKSHEFKKNRKGQPKHIPLRPDKILSNMYRNYFYKLIKQPIIIKLLSEKLKHCTVESETITASDVGYASNATFRTLPNKTEACRNDNT